MNDPAIKLSRREVLRLAIFSAISSVLTACSRAVESIAGASTPTIAPTIVLTQVALPASIDSVPITPNYDFYVTSANATSPVPRNWKLVVSGLVDQPLTLTLDDLKALPAVTEMRTLSCISNPVGGELISNALWQGVRLKDLLARAGVKNSARYLQLESFDNFWSTGIPLELGLDEHSLLVYTMNGEPLPPDHGAPLRCLFPGRYGMKQPKWIEKIMLVENEYRGFWEKQGWSNEARHLPFSRIDAPYDMATVDGATVTVSGVAFTDESGLAQIEINWDATNVWQTAELVRGPSPRTWTAWRWTGAAPSTGRHTLYARATDNRGKMQTRGQTVTLLGGTFPNGTDQMHSIVLDFKG